ncbi:MAG TPA: membrane dipeptidase [Candidatus Limnocylindrales bacterium]|jgi:microsomal dipeptidase-like Zn-dependent dipeptidase
MTRRRRLALAAGAAFAGAAAARPLLDSLVGRVEDRMNPVATAPATPVSARAAALHSSLRVGDLHADSLLWGRDLLVRGSRGSVDVPRLIEGNVALQVLSMPVKTPRGLNIERNADSSDQVLALAVAKRWPRATWGRLLPRVEHLAAQAHSLAERSHGAFRIVTSQAELAAYLAAREARGGMTAAVLAIEGAHALEDDPENVDVVADLGVRMISPAHFFDTAFGGSAHGLEQGGLTALGRELVARMEARRVLLDVAHASARTIDDALEVSTRPVVASHTGVRGVLDNARNLSDAHLAGIAATGGVVGIGFWPTACGGDGVAWIARSIAYAVERIGVAHVALGSDWDGAVPVPIDAAGTSRLTDALLDVGLADDDVRAVMGENVLRLFASTLPPA